MKTRQATVSFKTVGCRLNQAETAAIRASFEEAGFATVKFGASCDVCVIHGCVVTAKAEEDSLRLARSVKHRYPETFVILAGCAAELLNKVASDGRANPAERGASPLVYHASSVGEPSLVRRLGRDASPYLSEISMPEHADYLAGQSAKFNLPQILGMRFQTVEKQPSPTMPLFNTKRAIVKIQDGCDSQCAYCIVPHVRGPSRSRPAAEIIDEISRLTLCGFPEIVLTGANIGCYADNACRLPQLLEQIEAMPGLKRFRISSLEISIIAKDVIDFMAASKKICRFLHLPLQSGSDSILKAMGRPYTAEQFAAVVQYAQKKLGIFGLGTDIIAGFPGETEDDFLATERMVRQLPFSKLHVFSYSPRPGTPACSMLEEISAKDKGVRSTRLIELGRQKRREFAQTLIGKNLCFVVEKIKDGWAEGWTGEYLRARLHNPELKPKQIVEFICESATDDVLQGKSTR